MNLIKKILFFFNFTSKIKTFLFILSNFLLSFLEFIGLAMLIPALIMVFQVDQPIANSALKNFSLAVNQNFSLYFIILMLFFIYFFKFFFFIYLSNWKIKFMNEILIKISKNLLKTYMNSAQEYFRKNNSGEFLRNTTQESSKVIKALSASADLMFDLTLLLTAIIFLLFVSFKTTIIIVTLTLAFAMIYFFTIKKYFISIAKKDINLSGDSLKFLVECFRGHTEIFINNKQDFFIGKYLDKISAILKFKRHAAVIRILPRSLLELGAVTALLFFLSNISNEEKNLNYIFFNLTIFGSVFLRLYPTIGKLITNLQSVIYYEPSIDLIKDELNVDIDNFNLKKKSIFPESFTVDKIEFKNITFFYDEKKKILQNFNKTIYKNSIVGIVGKSGAGKTTLMHLLSGIINPSEGEIVINNKMRLKDLKHWTDKIAYVSQKPFIIDSTIRDNIQLGEEKQNFNQKRLSEAYFKSGLDEFINKLDHKDLNAVGDSGNLISAGQIQRIGIARALYKKADIFLLDEITSNLDHHVTESILNNIAKLKNNKIIFLISHDKKILDYCDETINL
jgi:ATP-binding cassette, subfamily B, bacterial PglK